MEGDPLAEYRTSLEQYRGCLVPWLEVQRLPLLPAQWAKVFGLSRMTMTRVKREPERHYLLVGGSGELTLLKVMAEE